MNHREFKGIVYEEIDNTILDPSKRNGFLIKMNIYSILLIIIISLLTALLFGLFNMDTSISFGPFGLVVVTVSFLVYIIIHELLHGVAFMIFGGVKKSELAFGIILKSGMAYCISRVPVPIKAARISLMMPVYAVCIPMYVIGFLMSNLGIAIVAVLFFSGSIADLYYMYLSKKAKKDTYMFEELPSKDHYEIGYRLYKKILIYK